MEGWCSHSEEAQNKSLIKTTWVTPVAHAVSKRAQPCGAPARTWPPRAAAAAVTATSKSAPEQSLPGRSLRRCLQGLPSTSPGRVMRGVASCVLVGRLQGRWTGPDTCDPGRLSLEEEVERIKGRREFRSPLNRTRH